MFSFLVLSVQFLETSFEVVEGGTVELVLRLSAPVEREVSVLLTTADITADSEGRH